MPLDQTFSACADLARSHYENFPVGAPWLRRREREDLAAIYAFCRTTDDLGDEYRGDRLAALNAWEAGLRSALAGEPPPDVPILAAVAQTATRRSIAVEPFLRVIEANRRDQTVLRHPDMESVLEYCSYSATPVGRMVLAVAGANDTDFAHADATCIGLQLANFWQDVARDAKQGRCYLPLDACRRHGVDPDRDLVTAQARPELRELIAEQVEIAREWLITGWPLASTMPIRWRPLVRAFSRGGWAICDAIAQAGFDPLQGRSTISRRRRVALLIHELARAPRKSVRLGTRR